MSIFGHSSGTLRPADLEDGLDNRVLEGPSCCYFPSLLIALSSILYTLQYVGLDNACFKTAEGGLLMGYYLVKIKLRTSLCPLKLTILNLFETKRNVPQNQKIVILMGR